MLVAALPYGSFYAVALARLAVIALLFSGDVEALEVHCFVRSGLTLSLKRMFRFLEHACERIPRWKACCCWST